MLTEFHKHLQESNLLPPGTKLLVAVSGGVDSVTLLHLLSELQKFYNWKITVAHYNHGVRKDSFLDAALVGELADQYGYDYLLGKYEGSSQSEAGLRKARYGYLEHMRRDTGSELIVTAHHGNDRVETALFNTIRGADREGMVALKDRRDNVVRPLLPFAKAEIIVLANLQNLPYREDSTNASLDYSRNFVRNVLIPQGSLKFRHFHHNFSRRLSKLQALNTRIDAGLDRLLPQLLVLQNQSTVEIKKAEFMSLPIEIQKSLLVRLIKSLQSDFQFSRQTLRDALKFVTQAQAGSRHSLPLGLHLINSYDTVIITSDPVFDTPDTAEVWHGLDKKKPFANKYFAVSVGSIPAKARDHIKHPAGKVYVRHRQAGDRVYPVGMEGSKKLQDVFVDAKVPRYLRDSWPVVVTATNQIVWVPQLVVDRRVQEHHPNDYITCEIL